VGGTSGQFKRQTDLKRSSGLRLSTPVRSLVERVAESAGLTYSDAIRLLVEEALAARAGEREKLTATLEALEKRVKARQFQVDEAMGLRLDAIDNGWRRLILAVGEGQQLTDARNKVVSGMVGAIDRMATSVPHRLETVEQKLDALLVLLVENLGERG
jgi:hypothetical protein